MTEKELLSQELAQSLEDNGRLLELLKKYEKVEQERIEEIEKGRMYIEEEREMEIESEKDMNISESARDANTNTNTNITINSKSSEHRTAKTDRVVTAEKIQMQEIRSKEDVDLTQSTFSFQEGEAPGERIQGKERNGKKKEGAHTYIPSFQRGKAQEIPQLKTYTPKQAIAFTRNLSHPSNYSLSALPNTTNITTDHLPSHSHLYAQSPHLNYPNKTALRYGYYIYIYIYYIFK